MNRKEEEGVVSVLKGGERNVDKSGEMRGVTKHRHHVSKPFSIEQRIHGKQVRIYFATEEEAAQALDAYKKSKIQARQEARQALISKRSADVAKNGDNSGLERRIAIQMVAAWQGMTGRNALVLNDCTRGDLLLERQDGRFLAAQLKTTHGKAKGRNYYYFRHVHGYTGMPVVCWCEADKVGWVADGTALDARTTKNLDITPDASLESKYTLAKGSMETLLTFLADHMDDWDSSTEDAARHDFASQCHQKEMRGIDAFKQRFPDSVCEWPIEQNGHVDLMVDGKRVQFKTARTLNSRAGFCVHLYTSAGKDVNGKQLYSPYPHDAFDSLVAVWEDADGISHFWRIPAAELTARGYLSTSTQPGKTTLWVYGPVGSQPDELACRKADVWSQQYYEE